VYRRAKKKVGAVIGGGEVRAFGVRLSAAARPACGTHGLSCEEIDGRRDSAGLGRGEAVKRIGRVSPVPFMFLTELFRQIVVVTAL
jgi:hypothetical protein